MNSQRWKYAISTVNFECGRALKSSTNFFINPVYQLIAQASKKGKTFARRECWLGLGMPSVYCRGVISSLPPPPLNFANLSVRTEFLSGKTD